MNSTELDISLAYKVESYGNVAWRVEGPVMLRDEDYEWSGIETIDLDRVWAHMIGDDRTFTFDVNDMIPIPDEDYCPECGQIGCTAYQ